MKKIFLLTVLVINFVFVQNITFAEDKYVETFYVDAIENKIEKSWLRPHDTAGKSAVVSFIVNEDGSVSEVSLLRGSGFVNFDISAVDAVYKAAPFEHLAGLSEPINIQLFFSPIFTSANVVSGKDESNIVNVANQNPYINFSDYTDTLQDKINSNWRPKAVLKQKSAIATIEIGKDGSLDNFYIVKSSRNKKFDRDIMDTIASSVPMDAFPTEINAPNTDVQLTFNCKRPKLFRNVPIKNHYVSANVMNVRGYDKYTKQAEKILADNFKAQRYFFHKDLIVELKINKTGKLKYVKIQKSSKDKNFDRKMLAILQKTSFPPIPETIPFNEVVLNYEIVTQRGHSFHDFLFDYLIYGGTTGLKSFSLAKEQY